jgi:hypothetical protein
MEDIMNRAMKCAGSVLLSGIVAAAALFPQGKPQCPPLIASLMPKNAVKVSCQYNAAGFVGLGWAAADLPFNHPCIQSTKYPGRISFDVKHYSGEGLELFRMQINAEEQQRFDNRKQELDKEHDKMQRAMKDQSLLRSVKTDRVPGGILLYLEYFIDCSEGVKRVKPYIKLLGVGHVDGTAINIEIEGFISSEAAKAAASEVLANFAKADFRRLDAGK